MKPKLIDLHFQAGVIGDKIKIIPYVFNKDHTKFKDLLSNKIYLVEFSKENYENFFADAQNQLAKEYNFDPCACLFSLSDFALIAFPLKSIFTTIDGQETIEHEKLVKVINKLEKIYTKKELKEREKDLETKEYEKKYEEEVKSF